MLRTTHLESRFRRAVLTAVLVTAGLTVHLTVQRLAPPPIVHAGGTLVDAFPFLPATVWIYLTFFPLMVATGALVPTDRYPRLVAAWTLASATAWTLVLLVPVTFSRPDPAAVGDGLHGWVFARLYGLDAAHVTFPCLHSAVTWISWWALRDRGPRLRAGVLALAAAITVSTMTTAQHLLTDNLGGLLIAGSSAWLMLPDRARSAAPRATATVAAAYGADGGPTAGESADEAPPRRS